MSQALTERIASYALDLRYEVLPEEVRDRTRQLLLDFLAVALGGRALSEVAPALLRGVRRLGGAGGACTAAGEKEGFTPHHAALLNAGFAHSMDFDDTHRDAVMHQGTPLFAALLAAGEETGCSGREFLTAAVAGYEIGARLGLAHGERVHFRGFHPTATTGIFAVTAAAARVLGLDRGTIESALGLDMSLTAGCQQFIDSGGWNKPLQVGMAAHNALYSLALAREGFQGAGRPLEGRFGYYATYAQPGSDLEQIAFPEDMTYEVLRVAIKPYPSCRYTHAAIDAVTSIVRREGVSPDDIEAIDIAVPPAGFQLVGSGPDLKRRPTSIVDGQFSVYFAAAVSAVDRSYSWDSYRRLDDPQVRRLMDRTTATSSDAVGGMGARVTLAAHGGSWTVDVPLPKGEPEDPLSWAEVEAKFGSLASALLDAGRVEEIAARVREVDKLDRISDLTGLLRP